MDINNAVKPSISDHPKFEDLLVASPEEVVRGPHSDILMMGGVRRIFLGLTFWQKGIFWGL